MTIEQCDHGINDNCDVTYRNTVEDFVNGKKVTRVGYWCRDHNRHGTWRMEEMTRKVNLPAEAES